MNLDELKSAWQMYDQKLQVSQTINEKIIVSMIRERSYSRVSRIKRENALLMLFMFLEMFFLIAVFAGNPFDFKYLWQYVPYFFILIGNVMGIFLLFRVYKMLKVEMTDINLNTFLQNIIDTYERNKKAEGWFGIILFVSSCLTVFSFLPNKLATKSITEAMIDTAIPLAISIFLYWLAFKLGAFENRKSKEFKRDLDELDKLFAELKEV